MGKVHVVDVKTIASVKGVSMTVERKVDKNVLTEVVDFIQQVNYGEVVITIHDSEIVQVEKKEKRRFKRCPPLCKQS
ncbi:MAG: YezD family protein [Nitrospinota bacterium]|nr:YezD family protein [Nitrospinota bacterium]